MDNLDAIGEWEERILYGFGNGVNSGVLIEIENTD